MRFLARSFFAVSLFLAGGGFAGWSIPASAAPPASTPVSIPSVVTATGEAYLPGVLKMVASAQVVSVVLHPQGRYALIVQREASPPPGAVVGQPTTGAVALLLYDARLNKTRTLWERRADGASHGITPHWLPGTDCAIAVASDYFPASEGRPDPTNRSGLLFFNFEKSLSARTLLTTPDSLTVSMSLTKPVYFLMSVLLPTNAVQERPKTLQFRRGDAHGTLGTPLTVPFFTYLGGFNAEGTVIYGFQETPVSPGSRLVEISGYFEWDGKTSSLTPLPSPPSSTTAEKLPIPPVLPFSAQTTVLPVPPVTKAVPLTTLPVALLPDATLHPLYLKAADTPEDAPNHFVLIAPDADRSYLLGDKSAVLYESGGALYAVPLVRLSKTAFADAQKARLRQVALQNAKMVGLSILMYAQDSKATFPPAGIFTSAVTPYLKDASVLAGFNYVFPKGGTLASVATPSTTPVGYVTVPGAGRAVLYVDGHVKWEDPN